ncbi:MAG: helix-turn-helix domain-containing protein [Saccharofermentanales bacterium]|jgi:transcriptional regulator with XRE-family HTH domain
MAIIDLMRSEVHIFGERLQALRKEKHLRQADVARALNTGRQTISKYECGQREPDYTTLIRLADFYDVSIDYLFGRTEERRVAGYPKPLDINQWFTSVAEARRAEEKPST